MGNTIGKWWFNGILWDLPSGHLLQFAIENGPVEKVSFPPKKRVDLSSSLCGCLPEGSPVVRRLMIP